VISTAWVGWVRLVMCSGVVGARLAFGVDVDRGDDRKAACVVEGMFDFVGGFRLVMALNEWAFRAKHIPGSELFNNEQELFSSLGPEDDIVVYCTSDDCHGSVAVYHGLVDHGYPSVRRYSGRLPDWEAAGLPSKASG
jgi:rhodanese-related sulfurtransferase